MRTALMWMSLLLLLHLVIMKPINGRLFHARPLMLPPFCRSFQGAEVDEKALRRQQRMRDSLGSTIARMEQAAASSGAASGSDTAAMRLWQDREHPLVPGHFAAVLKEHQV